MSNDQKWINNIPSISLLAITTWFRKYFLRKFVKMANHCYRNYPIFVRTKKLLFFQIVRTKLRTRKIIFQQGAYLIKDKKKLNKKAFPAT